MKRPTVFISYSWDSQEHRDWVLKLATDLMEKFGIEIILDQFELSAGGDLTHFMESSIEKSDKVLLILTPNYKTKAENRDGGVGYETSMISHEIFESPINKIKFIPILKEGSIKKSSPNHISSKVYHQMTDDNNYIFSLYDLAMLIYNKPKIEKPKLGDIPDFKKPSIDPIIDISNQLTNEERINKELDQIINSSEGVSIANKDIKELFDNLKQRSEVYKNNTELHFSFETDNRNNGIIRCNNYSVTIYLENNVVNSSTDTKLIVRNWNGFRKLNDSGSFYFPGDEPTVIQTMKYNFDLNLNKEPVWKNNSEILTKTEIANNTFSFLVGTIRNEKSKRFR